MYVDVKASDISVVFTGHGAVSVMYKTASNSKNQSAKCAASNILVACLVTEVTTCSYNVKSYVHTFLHIIIISSGVMVRALD